MVKLGAYAEAARDLSAHLRNRKEPLTQGHGQNDNRVATVYLPRQRGPNKLHDVAYLFTAR